MFIGLFCSDSLVCNHCPALHSGKWSSESKTVINLDTYFCDQTGIPQIHIAPDGSQSSGPGYWQTGQEAQMRCAPAGPRAPWVHTDEGDDDDSPGYNYSGQSCVSVSDIDMIIHCHQLAFSIWTISLALSTLTSQA